MAGKSGGISLTTIIIIIVLIFMLIDDDNEETSLKDEIVKIVEKVETMVIKTKEIWIENEDGTLEEFNPEPKELPVKEADPVEEKSKEKEVDRTL